jgi:hypothetical protein
MSAESGPPEVRVSQLNPRLVQGKIKGLSWELSLKLKNIPPMNKA